MILKECFLVNLDIFNKTFRACTYFSLRQSLEQGTSLCHNLKFSNPYILHPDGVNF